MTDLRATRKALFGAAAVVGIAWLISIPMLVLVGTLLLGALLLTSLPGRGSVLGAYAWTLPLAAAIMAAIGAKHLGASPTLGLAIVVAVNATGLVVLTVRGKSIAVSRVVTAPVLGVFAVPLGSLAVVEHLGFPGASFSWLLVGDGIAETQIMGIYRFLDPFTYIPLHYPLSTSGHLLLADAISFSGGGSGGAQFVADAQAIAAVVVVAAITGVLQLQSGFGTDRRGWSGLPQGLVLGVVASSGIVLGLPAINGFISTAVTFALLTLALSAAVRLARRGSGWDLAVAAVAVLGLLSTWQPVAVTAAALTVAAMWSRWRRVSLPVSASVAIAVTFAVWAVAAKVRDVPGPPFVDAGFYYFPITPIAMFLLAAVALAALPTRGLGRTGGRTAGALAVTGMIVFTATSAGTDVLGVLADSHVLSSTRYYYVLKYIWLVCMPLIPLLLVMLLRDDVRRRIGTRTAAFAIVAVVGASFMAANTPNLAWLTHVNGERDRAVAEAVMTAGDDPRTRVYVNYASPAIDQTLNGLSGWFQRFYDPATAIDFSDTANAGLFYADDARWPGRVSALDTTSVDDDTLCWTLSTAPEPAVVLTTDDTTATHLTAACAEIDVELVER